MAQIDKVGAYMADVRATYAVHKAKRDIEQAIYEILPDLDDEDEERIRELGADLIAALFDAGVKYDASARFKAKEIRNETERKVCRR